MDPCNKEPSSDLDVTKTRYQTYKGVQFIFTTVNWATLSVAVVEALAQKVNNPLEK